MAYHSTQGSEFKVSIATVMTTIPQCYEINAPGIERRFKDVTNLGSTGNFTEYVSLMNDTSEAGFKLRWDPDNTVHDFLIDQSLLAVGVLDSFEIEFSNGLPSGSTMTFSGYMMRFQPLVAANDILEAEASVRVSGAVTFTQ
jgi:hypothetical protein